MNLVPAFLRIPFGYEDASGFHFGDEPLELHLPPLFPRKLYQETRDDHSEFNRGVSERGANQPVHSEAI